MGRHRRSAAGRATGVTQTDGPFPRSRDPLDSYTGDTVGIAPYLNPDAYAGTYARSEAYLFAPDGEHGTATAVFASDGFTPGEGLRRAGSHRRPRKRAVKPVRSGLLGVSAAVAIGTVAVATGVLPGGDNYTLGGGSGGDKVQAADSPTSSPSEQGGTSGSAESRDDSTPASRDQERAASPSPSPSPSTSSAAPTKTPEKKKPSATPGKKPKVTPTQAAPEAPEPSEAPVTVSAEAAAAAEVLKLVNEERAKVGCSAVAANSALTELATAFSEDMAARGFFDHTDPDGASPWDRAAKAGITDLGGENIARGQADAAAVMDAWMNSPGHKANILNCDFKTLGVGVHYGAGGPWWTQNFGY
ncbi:CAP domain-containing protein [Streptomyces sp. CC219B]|uniref:CAP domain-containing protein n=1 Tax=Streptomyces sp. CC219B TaxID=3044574 RepID=UPI0024A9B884|nr:CAP domain-containing protein [Streptomyces sp. CC219B]